MYREKDCAETVRAVVCCQARQPGLGTHGNRGQGKNDQRGQQSAQHDHFVLQRTDLRPEIFGSSSNHQPGEKNCDRSGHDDAVESGAQTSEDYFSYQSGGVVRDRGLRPSSSAGV